jgi:hypothetical protein
MTLTACIEDDNGTGDGDENGNGGNSGGGVSGKRIKKMAQTTGPADGMYRQEYSYNSDGTIKRVDGYDEASKLIMYFHVTHNPDGTKAKEEAYNAADNSRNYVFTYTYDTNKKPKKAEGAYYAGEVQYGTVTVDYTFQNGRKTREVLTSTSGFTPMNVRYDYSYDSSGKRTATVETHSITGTRQYTRAYNSDGTLQKVTYPYGYNNSDNRTVTKTYTWEKGKSAINDDDLLFW